MKKSVFFMFLGVLFFSSTVFAGECSSGKSCPMGGDKQCSMSKSEEDCHPCPIVGKIMKKACFFLENKDEIGLSDDQVKTIKQIKTDVTKSGIRQKAEMEIFAMDMEAKLSEEKVDVEGLNAMIDEGMASMSKSAKSAVETYAKLKSVLTADQMSKAKAVWKKK